MSLLTILHHPDPRLRRKAPPVTVFDDALQTLILMVLDKGAEIRRALTG